MIRVGGLPEKESLMNARKPIAKSLERETRMRADPPSSDRRDREEKAGSKKRPAKNQLYAKYDPPRPV